MSILINEHMVYQNRTVRRSYYIYTSLISKDIAFWHFLGRELTTRTSIYAEKLPEDRLAQPGEE